MSKRFYLVVNCNGRIRDMNIDVIFKSDSPVNMMFGKDITLVEMKR